MKFYYLFIIFIVIAKFIFFGLSIYREYLVFKKLENTNLYKNIDKWRLHSELLVNVLISFLLIYLFNPHYPKLYLIDKETKIILFAYGWITLVTASWEDIFGESFIFKLFKHFFK